MIHNKSKRFSIGIVGVRGYVGQALIKLVDIHPILALSFVSSRQLQGKCSNEAFGISHSLVIENLSPQQVADKHADIVVLALPNGLAKSFADKLVNSASTKIVIDLSADHRFDEDWIYSVPEIISVPEINPINKGKSIDGIIKISNPGCYATAMQLAIAPLKDLLSQTPNCFGVSGYSGAGTKPCKANDLTFLKDNLLTYTPVEHLHELEVSKHLGLAVSFTPHVVSFFRGINMTIHLAFRLPATRDGIASRLIEFYQNHPLVEVVQSMPTVKQVANSYQAQIGGLTISKNGFRATVVCCLDNLLKGAASQAIQNINLALGESSSLGLINDNKMAKLMTPVNADTQLIGE